MREKFEEEEKEVRMWTETKKRKMLNLMEKERKSKKIQGQQE